jgi:hypothetical protein
MEVLAVGCKRRYYICESFFKSETKNVSKTKNTININGKTYDSHTGALLSHAAPTAPSPAKAAPEARGKLVHDVVRQPAKHAHGHTPQAAKTLMRKGVAKPGTSPKLQLKTQSHTGSLVAQPTIPIHSRAMSHVTHAKRLQHAQKTVKSPGISRFPFPSAAPVPRASLVIAASPVARHQPRPAPASKPRTTSDVLQRAIDHATGHEQLPVSRPVSSRRQRRVVRFVVLPVVAIGLIGVVAILNLTNIKLHVASSNAGFSVSLPQKQPTGFTIGTLQSSPGSATIQFKSNSDDRTYTLTEKTSDWNSEALRSGFIAGTNKEYQTIESAGRTVYVYDQSHATWVSGGIWYQLENNGALSQRQLVELATSL